jgi:hypothetical protein
MLAAPADGSMFPAPANVSMLTTASDTDGTIARVDFFANGQPLGSDATSPYEAAWSAVSAGTHSLAVVATDDDGATATPAATITVTAPADPPTPTAVAFTPSADHDTAVTSYSVAIRRAADPATATPAATKNLGKPAPANGDTAVDVSDIVNPLPSGLTTQW